MSDDIKTLSQRQDTLEKQFGDFIKEWRDQRGDLFKKLEDIAKDSDHKRDEMWAHMESKLDATRPDPIATWTRQGVIVAVFSIIVASMMWITDREFSHVKNEYTEQIDALRSGLAAMDAHVQGIEDHGSPITRERLAKLENDDANQTQDILRLRDWNKEQVASELQELRERRMNDKPGR